MRDKPLASPITGETWGDVIEPVRELLLQEAALPFSALRPKLAAARQDLLNAIEGISEQQAAFRPPTGEGEAAWGIAEALRHVASVEAIMADRIRQLGSGQPLQLTPTYPGYMEAVDTRRLPELAAAITTSHTALLAAVAEIEGHERLDTFDTHRRFGELNCRGWLVMHGLHEQDHARQIEKIKRLDGYPSRCSISTGPPAANTATFSITSSTSSR
ncbi:MAG: DinB family protein [Chloroflexi bacterium]|nr:DinB family protein [Chloroflexota bacterium]